MTREELLKQAEQIVSNDRNGQYGQPEDNFSIIADYWGIFLGRGITAKEVAVMMALFKIARMQTAIKNKADSWIDAIGYLACGGEIAWKEEGED